MSINIHVFKIVFPDGSERFESKTRDHRGSCGCRSLLDLAENVKDKIVDFFNRNSGDLVQASIDTRPYHDIEWSNGLLPHRCLPLDDEEIEEFWQCFNK